MWEIDILGTVYSMTEEYASNEPVLEDCGGVTDFTSKRIVIRKYAPEENRLDTNDNPDVTTAQVIRHEVIHAFLFESGLNDYAHDETLVEWLAIQFPKINKVFMETIAIKSDRT